MTNPESNQAVRHAPIESCAAWKGADLVESNDWIHQFSQEEISELHNALQHAKFKGLSGTQVSVEDFPLAKLSAVIKDLVDELVEGRGFKLLRGFPALDYSKEDASTVFWGIGTHIGKAWPQTWYEWRLVMPLMAAKFQLIAPDLRGLGDSSRPLSGYEKKSIAMDIWQLMHDHLGHQKFHLVGHDVGGPVAYRLAMDQPDAVRRLVLVDVLIRNDLQLRELRAAPRWHHGFNQIIDLPEALTAGREEIFLSWFYRAGGARPDAITPEAQKEYVRAYSQPGGMRAAFNYYRVMPQDQRDNIESFGDAKLSMPVLTLAGGAHSGRGAHSQRGDLMQQSLERVSDNVTSFVVEGAGHWIPEEQPGVVAEHLNTFFGES